MLSLLSNKAIREFPEEEQQKSNFSSLPTYK